LKLRYSSFHCSVVKSYDYLSEVKNFYWFTVQKTLFWMITERLIDVWRDSECCMLYKTEIVQQMHDCWKIPTAKIRIPKLTA
jgi:hypothetical protein